MTLDELEALANTATPGPWYHCQPFQVAGKIKTIHGMVPAHRIDFVSTNKEPVHEKVILGMESTSSNDMAFIAAVNPQTIKQLIELCRMQHEMIENAKMGLGDPIAALNKAITAFEQFWKDGK
jgi:hypothetical protein